MWCVPTLDAAYIDRMEDVLKRARASGPMRGSRSLPWMNAPWRCGARAAQGRSLAPGRRGARGLRVHCRRGTGEHLLHRRAEDRGRHVTHATRDRKTPRFVPRPPAVSPDGTRVPTIHLVMDNLNLHCQAAVIGVLGRQQGAAVVRQNSVLRATKTLRDQLAGYL